MAPDTIVCWFYFLEFWTTIKHQTDADWRTRQTSVPETNPDVQIGLGFLVIKKVCTPRTPRAPRAFDVCPPMRFRTLWSAWCIVSTHHALHRTNANLGGRLEGVHKSIKMSDEPSDESEVANNTSDVPEQVPGKKRDAARNKRDASVLEKLKTSSVEDIILDETKTQILSIAGVEYSSLSAKV